VSDWPVSDWIDLQLSHHMAPVAAPDALWNKVSQAKAPRRESPARPSSSPAFALPLVATVILTLGLSAMWLLARTHPRWQDLQHLAAEQLYNSDPLQLESANADEIAVWMRREAGIALRLHGGNPAGGNPDVRLLGARVIRFGGSRIGAVSYRVGEHRATMLVARAAGGSGISAGPGPLACKGRDQVLAVACSNPSQPELACLLCHTGL
jgi:hypothetical protein